MKSIGQFFRNLVGATPQSRSSSNASKRSTPEGYPTEVATSAPKDTFTGGLLFSNPISEELAQMAREMKPASKPAPSNNAVVADKNYERATRATFEREFGEAVDASLKAKGYRPLSRRQKSSPAASYLAAAPKLSPKACLRIASDVMKKHITPSQTAGASQAVRNAVKASPMPVSRHNNIPVHVSSEIALAQADTQAITLSPTVFDSKPCPMKYFLIGHEEHHVRQKDSVGTLGMVHLKDSLDGHPAELGELETAQQELSYEKELAADRAGADLAVQHFGAEAAEKGINDLLHALAPMATYNDHPEMQARADNISHHIAKRQKAAPANKSAVFDGLVFNSPIFDDLKDMMAG